MHTHASLVTAFVLTNVAVILMVFGVRNPKMVSGSVEDQLTENASVRAHNRRIMRYAFALIGIVCAIMILDVSSWYTDTVPVSTYPEG